MTSSTLVSDYVGKGLASARPVSLSLPSAALGVYYATDTAAVSLWDGAAWNAYTPQLDLIGSAQGDLLYRASSAWAVLAPGTSGQVLQSGGAAANPSWTAATTPRNKGVIAAQWVLGTIATNGNFYFVYKTPYAGTINSLDSLSATGTFTLATKINGSNVTGLSAVAVSTAANTAATAAHTFSAGDTISGTISSASGSPTDAVLALNVTWS